MSEHVVRSGIGSWEKDINEVRRNLIREMNRAGAYRLEGEYSGGHDEGGLDILNAFDKDGQETAVTDPLYETVQDLLSTKFYTWALDCYVTGSVYVDLREKRAWTEGQMEVSRYEDDEDSIDLRW